VPRHEEAAGLLHGLDAPRTGAGAGLGDAGRGGPGRSPRRPSNRHAPPTAMLAIALTGGAGTPLTGPAVQRTDLRGARIGSPHAVTASRASGRVSSNRRKHRRGPLLLPLLDLRQVALGDSGEASKRVPRYVREFSLGVRVPAGVGQLAGELGHDGSTGSVAIGVGSRNATGPGAGRASTCRAPGSIGRQ